MKQSDLHESALQIPLAVCRDGLNMNGNISDYTPCRAALIEIEWLSNSAADLLFNEGYPNNLSETASRMRLVTAERLSEAAIEDIRHQP